MRRLKANREGSIELQINMDSCQALMLTTGFMKGHHVLVSLTEGYIVQQAHTSDAKESSGESVPEVRMMERASAAMLRKATAGLRDQRQNWTAHPDKSVSSSSRSRLHHFMASHPRHCK